MGHPRLGGVKVRHECPPRRGNFFRANVFNLSSEFGVPSSEERCMRFAQAMPTVFSLDFFHDNYQNWDRNIDFLPKRFFEDNGGS